MYFYFVDDERFETAEAHSTGAEIRARLPEPKRVHELYLAGHGDPKPILIGNDVRVSFDEGPKYFVTTLPKKTYHYFVDGERFESDVECTTGSIIRSKLGEKKRGYALFLEGKGNEPDQMIQDNDTVSFGEHEQHRLYTVPPASFG